MLQTIVRNHDGRFNANKDSNIQYEKLPIEWFEQYLIGKDTAGDFLNSVIQLYEAIDFKQIFGRKEVEEILNCSYRNAGYTIAKMVSCEKWSNEEFFLKKLLEHEYKMLDDLKSLLTEKENDQEQNLKISVLNSSWIQIHEQIEALSYERYIDDQLEIEEIWKICSALVKYMKENSEPWSLRRKVLQEIIENEYYDYYGCYDPMEDLLEVLCCAEEEYIEIAEIMEQHGKGEKAAKIYYKYGYVQKYIDCLRKRLAKKSDTYLELIDYYDSHDCYEKAVELAWIALEKCKDDLTDIFVFLIKDAYKNGDKTSADKLYNRAKRRTRVNINKIDEKLSK